MIEMPEEPDIFSEAGLRDRLRPRAFGHPLYFFHTIDSTNAFAKKLAAAGGTEGTLVLSEVQTRGRGRSGKSWVSPPGTAILMSVILRPPLPPLQAARITLLTAVSVAVAVERVAGLEVGIKWPNDIIIDDRKACGILTEMGTDSRRVPFLVVGIGINVNAQKLPAEIEDTATSLRLCLGRKVSRPELLTVVIEELESSYCNFVRTRSIEKTITAYRQRSVTIGKRIRVFSPDREFFARAIDIAGNGELMVRKDDGETETINSGEISVRDVSL